MPNKKINDLPKPNPYLTPISILIAGGLIAAALFINKTASKSKDESVVAGTTDQQNQNQPQSQNQGQVAGTEVKKNVDVGNSPIKGDPNAPVTIVEFSNFQCGHCRSYAQETFPQIESQYIKTGKVKYAVKSLSAQSASEALLCAGQGGKYWQMYDLLFEKSDEWGAVNDPTTKFNSYATTLGINVSSCLANHETADEVKADSDYGQQLGVQGTPTFFVNGRLITGAQPFEGFKKIIEEELAK